MQKRQYQDEAINKCIEALTGTSYHAPILQAPTGSGKTYMAAKVVEHFRQDGSKILWLAPRRELIYQAQERLESVLGIEVGIIMAGERTRYSPVQVASFDTLHSRAIRQGTMEMPEAHLVVVDECHLSISKTRLNILAHYDLLLGLTATPARGDGRGLGMIYDTIIQSASIRELQESGYLVPVKYFSAPPPDVSGVAVRRGDYVVKELEQAVDQNHLVGDIVDNYSSLAPGKSAVVFCVSRKHARHVCEDFQLKGIDAEYVDGETPVKERAEIFDRVRSGETHVLVSVFVPSYGLDIPRLEVCINARPTKSIVLYMQQIGRVLRPFNGKSHAMVLDHAGCFDVHGPVEIDKPWSLDGKTTIQEREKEQRAGEPKEISCGMCGTVFTGSRVCPECETEVIPQSEPIPTYPAELREISWKEMAKSKQGLDMNKKFDLFGMLKMICKQRNYSPGWAAHKYREFTGAWPDPSVRRAPAMIPSKEVQSWVRSRQIAWAKSRNNWARRNSD